MAYSCEGGKEHGHHSDSTTASSSRDRGEQEIGFPCSISPIFQNFSHFPG